MLPLGGIGNVTKNMYIYEYEGSILIVDCGIGFPDPTMLGVDLLIPDISYLADKLDRIVGLVLSHGHDDHIAGIPYIVPQLGSHFKVYGSKLTIGFAKDRIKDFPITVNFEELPRGPLQLGPFTIENIHVTHSVPDARHLVITTAEGTIYHGTDFKFDLNPIDGVLPDFQAMARVGQKGVLALLSDCLNAEEDEYSISESSLSDMFEREMRHTKGKSIITVMSSNIHRIQQVVNIAAAFNRKVAFVGRSIEQNVKTAVALGFLKLPDNIVINKARISNHPDHKVCILIAGSQGQVGSSLARAAEGEHNLVKIKPADRIVFASEAIPGNEQSVYATIDSLSRTGADVTYSDLDDTVHASGHSSSIEQKMLISFVKPNEVIPIGGTYHHMIEYRKNARSLGYSDKNIHLLDNGQILSISRDGIRVKETIALRNVMVDGLGIGDVGRIVLRDRQQMAEDGIVIIVVPVNQQSGQVTGEVEVISRGFVYVKENKELI
jgi:ribonuclease J